MKPSLVTGCALNSCPLAVNGVGVQIWGHWPHSVEKLKSCSLMRKWPDRGVWATELGELQMERTRVACHPSNLETVQNPDPDSIEIKISFCSLWKTGKTSYCDERSLMCVGVVYIMCHIRTSTKSKVASSAAVSHLLLCYNNESIFCCRSSPIGENWSRPFAGFWSF